MTGKVALMTGAASGIGRATTLYFAERETAVMAADVDRAGLEQTLAMVLQKGGRARIRRADVTSSADMRRLVEEAESSFGGLDILFNGAGVLAAHSAEETDEEEWERTFSVNVKGAFLSSKHAIPAMRRRGGGAIINMGSVYALASTVKIAAYAASKGALLSLTRQVALDCAADKIRVNCILAGAIDTPLLRSDPRLQRDPDAGLKTWGARHPMNRVGRPEEVASVAYFLASDAASFITGAAIPVDGGMLARLFS